MDDRENPSIWDRSVDVHPWNFGVKHNIVHH